MRSLGALVLALALASPAAAGELLLANGSRFEGDLVNEMLLVSTGSDLIEVAPDTVAQLTPTEVQLKDGRVLHGTLVGGRVRARTALGELAIKSEDLRLFRADDAAAPAMMAPAPAVATLPAMPPLRVTPVSTAPVASSRELGLPPVSLYQPPPAAASPEPARPVPPAPAAPAPAANAPPAPAGVAVAAVAPAYGVGRPVPGLRLEVVAESALHRDALSGAPAVGRVTLGDRVTYLDAIDRRLWVFNTLVFDGGHWIKVRAADGTVGWLPATVVREAR